VGWAVIVVIIGAIDIIQYARKIREAVWGSQEIDSIDEYGKKRRTVATYCRWTRRRDIINRWNLTRRIGKEKYNLRSRIGLGTLVVVVVIATSAWR